MPSPRAHRRRVVGLVPTLLVGISAVVAVQIVNFDHVAGGRPRALVAVPAAFQRSSDTHRADGITVVPAPPPTTTTTSPPAPTPPAPTTTTTAPTPPPAPAPAVAPAVPAAPEPGAVPAVGQATAEGCAAAAAYLAAYAYPGFTVECPGNAMGREAMTCLNEAGVCPGQAIIAIADACPAAYMNEASNSWVLEGQSSAPIDPYGTC